MPLKVVPGGDERCDIHNGRTPASYICKDCMRELGVEAESTPAVRGKPIRRLQSSLRRTRRHARRRVRSPGRRRALIAGAAIVAIAATILLVTNVTGGGGGGSGSGGGIPSEEDVVNALGLSPDPNGTGWITLDGSCAVVSIQIGPRSHGTTTTASGGGEASNADGTVRAVVENAFSQSQTACVDRISAALRAHF